MEQKPLALKFRPSRFVDVRGQELPVQMLQAILKHPETAPRTIILGGAYGSGKTTLARIFAKGLRCENLVKGELCGMCEACQADLERDVVPWYLELDSATAGNKAYIEALKERLRFQGHDGWRVVVIDEAHLILAAAQGSLLSLLEDVPSNTYFVFCTTDAAKLTDPIRSRGVVLECFPLPQRQVELRLIEVAQAEGFDLPLDSVTQLARCARGHLRDALMMLDQYRLIEDKPRFLKSLVQGDELVLKFLQVLPQHNKAECQQLLAAMLSLPLARLQQAWEQVVLELLEVFVGAKENPLIKPVVDLYGNDLFKLHRCLCTDWVEQAFRSDTLYQGFFWNLYFNLKKEVVTTTAPVDDWERYRKKT